MEPNDMKRLLPALFALAVAGCSNGSGMVARYDGLEQEAARPTRTVGAEDMLVKIPEWAGAIKSASQFNDGGVLRQKIVIAGGTHGDNFVDIAVDSNGRSLSSPRAQTSAEIEDDLRAKFPGVAMRIVGKQANDANAPYDIAVGRSADGGRCLYAWKWTDNLRVTSDPSGIAAVTSIFSQRAMPASLQIRLCSKYVTLDDLNSLAQQIRFASIVDADRILGISAPAAQAAAPQPIVHASLESALACPGANADFSPLEKRALAAPRAARRSVARARRASAPVEAAAVAPATANGVRYLAAPPTGAGTAPTASAAAASGEAQSLGLPAIALHGPSPAAAKPAPAPAGY
jgi:Cellulose biosynthesis protein BcsN